MLLSRGGQAFAGGWGASSGAEVWGDKAGRSCTDRPGSCGDSGAGPRPAVAASEPLPGHSALGRQPGSPGAWQEAAGAQLPWQRPDRALWAKGRGGAEPEWEGAVRGVRPLPPAGCMTTGQHSCCLLSPRPIQNVSRPHLRGCGEVAAPCVQAHRKQNVAAQGGGSPLTGSAGALAAETSEKGPQEHPRSPQRPPTLQNDRPDGPLSSPAPGPQPRGRSGAGGA